MLITILAAGSTGDTIPYIALGKELKKAGDRVRFATFRNFENLIKNHGLEFHPIHGDIRQAAASTIGQEAMQADNPLKLLLSFNKLKDLAQGVQNDLFEACKGADLIIYHPGCAVGFFAAQQFGIPSVMASPFPMTPTRAFPALIFYDFPRLGKGFNFLSHKIFEKIMWMAAASPVKNLWQREFGQKPQGYSIPYSKQTTQTRPTIVSCSNFVFAQPDDYPQNVTHTGYWFLEDDTWQPSKELSDFLKSGKTPVYVGFGSLGNKEAAEQTINLVVEALIRSGQRGVFASGWSGLAKSDLNSNDVFLIDAVPHTWLFPRVAAVVHHGGAGTTAAGLQAGVPSVIIPFSNDQFAWGRRVFELGVGPNPIPRKKLTVDNLSQAIQSALSPEIRQKAADLGIKIRTENGVEKAATIIHSSANTKKI